MSTVYHTPTRSSLRYAEMKEDASYFDQVTEVHEPVEVNGMEVVHEHEEELKNSDSDVPSPHSPPREPIGGKQKSTGRAKKSSTMRSPSLR